MKKISTITPCHNSTKYLKKCWESLKNQTIGIDNMEVIFVDDASDDDGATWKMLLSFEKEAPESVMVVHLDENVRQGGARNVGLSYATGEYVQFLDSDDSLKIEALEELYNIAEEKNTDMIQYDFYHPNGKRAEDPYCRENIDFELSTPLARKGMLASEKISLFHAAKFYRRDFLIASDVHFAEYVIYEEPMFVYPLLFFAKRIAVITNQYYIYQVNEVSTMETTAYERLEDHMVVQKMLYEFLKTREEIYNTYKKEIDAYFYRTFCIETVVNSARGAKISDEMIDALVIEAGKIPYNFPEDNLFSKEQLYLWLTLERLKQGFASKNEFLEFAKKADNLVLGKKVSVDIVLAVASRGGLENVLNLICGYLQKSDYQVRVVQILETGTGWLDSNVEYYGLTTSDKITYLSEMKDYYKTFARKNGMADIVLCTGWPLITQFVAETAQELEMPSYICSYLHGSLEHYSKDGVGGIECLASAKAHFCINHNGAITLSEKYPFANIFELGNPIPRERVSFSRNRNKYSLVYIGRFSSEKNPKMILRALSQAPEEFSLKLVGDGEEREELRELCETLQIIDRVEFLGWLDNPWECLQEDGFLILASYFEGFPLAAAEAMLSGMPVISTPVQGLIDYLKPGINGYLYEQERPDQLAEILKNLRDGLLPYPDSEDCFLSAEQYLAENVIEKVESALLKMYIQ